LKDEPLTQLPSTLKNAVGRDQRPGHSASDQVPEGGQLLAGSTGDFIAWPSGSVFLMVLCLGVLFVVSGCASTQSGSGFSGANQGGWTPVDHARAQLEWIRGSSDRLSEEELFHAVNTPWSGRRWTPAQREQWIRDQLLEDSRGSRPDVVVSGRRVLDRPAAMDAAIDRWQQELKENRSD
jgi:hypothetical protein